MSPDSRSTRYHSSPRSTRVAVPGIAGVEVGADAAPHPVGRCLTATERSLARYPVEHVGGRLHARLRPVPRPSWAALLRAHARDGRPPSTSHDAGA